MKLNLFEILLYSTFITMKITRSTVVHRNPQRLYGKFGGCKVWQNRKENIIGGINFGVFVTKV